MKKMQQNIELLTASLFVILVDTSVFPQIPSSLLDNGLVQIKKGTIAWCCSRLGGSKVSVFPGFLTFRMWWLWCTYSQSRKPEIQGKSTCCYATKRWSCPCPYHEGLKGD
jgi:hypothetical protein